jgi:hypothetical protein
MQHGVVAVLTSILEKTWSPRKYHGISRASISFSPFELTRNAAACAGRFARNTFDQSAPPHADNIMEVEAD